MNRQFLDWLSSTHDGRRPFFAFLNYINAHSNYVFPDDFDWRFGKRPNTERDWELISNWYFTDKRSLSDREISLGRDAYDNCIAYLDEQFGKLVEQLAQRGVLDDTLIIITSDHGESFGEHGFFMHPCSLYQAEIHVPLLMRLPRRLQAGPIVDEFVSLRHLPATVIDALGIASGSRFPGHSLTRFWTQSTTPAACRESEEVLAEVYTPISDNPDRALMPAVHGPMASLAVDGYVYIRSEGDHLEELYDLRHDPEERWNLADVAAMGEVLEGFRRRLQSSIGDLTRLQLQP